MNTRIFASRSLAWPTCLLVVLLTATALAPRVGASDVDVAALAKAADKELGDGQRAMFSGKTDDALAKLKSAVAKIKRIKAAEPEHVSIKQLEPKAAKLAKDLERRTGKKLDLFDKPAADAVPGATAEKAPAAPAKSSAGQLPYAARQPMQQFESAYTRANDNYARYATTDADMKDSLVKRVGDSLGYMKANLESAKAEAAKAGVTAHPDFETSAGQIAEIEKKYAEIGEKKAASDAATTALAGDLAKDAEALVALRDRLRDNYFNKASGVAIYWNQLAEVEACLSVIETFEKEDQAKTKEFLAGFTARYGSTPGEIRKRFDEGGYASSNQPHLTYEEIVTGVENVTKTRDAMGADVARRARERADTQLGKKGHDFFMLENANAVRAMVALAVRFSPETPEVKELGTDIDGMIQTAMADWSQRIDARIWPGNAANAPSNAAGLARVAMEWFANDPGWGKRATNPEAEDKEPRVPVGVLIMGPWSVQKTNLLGQPIMYGVPAHVAVQLEREKKDRLVRVYNVTLRTIESANAKMEPPFTSITVGDSWYIRPEKVK